MTTAWLSQSWWLNWLAGNDPQRAGSPELHWANLPESWGVFVFVALVAAVIAAVYWLYRHEMQSCPPRVKQILAIFRTLVLLLLVILLLRPMVTYKQVRLSKPVIGLVRDTSMSIAWKDHYSNPTQAAQTAAATGLDPQQLTGGQVSGPS